MDLFFGLYFNFRSAKTEINKNINKRFNLINLERSDALKRQKYDTWLAMWLNHFEIDVIWETFREFLKVNSHISVFWGFWWISVISLFSFLGIGLKTKTRKPRKMFSFLFFSSQAISNGFLCKYFIIFNGRYCNYLVYLLFPWFPWFPWFRPGRLKHRPRNVK